ncbi:hypothetical protein JCM18237_23230 [Halorubrum luteum]
MTDDETRDETRVGSRTAAVRTTHADADRVAAALGPDNTDSMAMRVDGDRIACTVERSTTGGLRSTVDDYVVNLQVADELIERARAHRGTNRDANRGTNRDANRGTNRDANRSTNTFRGDDPADADASGGERSRPDDTDRSRPDPGSRSETTGGDQPRTNGSDDNT